MEHIYQKFIATHIGDDENKTISHDEQIELHQIRAAIHNEEPTDEARRDTLEYLKMLKLTTTIDFKGLFPHHFEIIRAALQQPSVTQWQPIETAPRDGAVFLATWIYDGIRRYGVFKSHTFTNGKMGYIKHSGWDEKEECFYGMSNNCTHWMPLPQPPSKGDE